MKEYTQEELGELISCPKIITEAERKDLTLDRGHWRKRLILLSEDGKYKFSVFLRKADDFADDFSVGLIFHPKDEKESLVLFRCNGPHEKTEDPALLKKDHFGYHIHKGKAEWINDGDREPKSSGLTKEYASFEESVYYFVQFTGIKNAKDYLKIEKPMPLFDNPGRE